MMPSRNEIKSISSRVQIKVHTWGLCHTAASSQCSYKTPGVPEAGCGGSRGGWSHPRSLHQVSRGDTLCHTDTLLCYCHLNTGTLQACLQQTIIKMVAILISHHHQESLPTLFWTQSRKKFHLKRTSLPYCSFEVLQSISSYHSIFALISLHSHTNNQNHPHNTAHYIQCPHVSKLSWFYFQIHSGATPTKVFTKCV